MSCCSCLGSGQLRRRLGARRCPRAGRSKGDGGAPEEGREVAALAAAAAAPPPGDPPPPAAAVVLPPARVCRLQALATARHRPPIPPPLPRPPPQAAAPRRLRGPRCFQAWRHGDSLHPHPARSRPHPSRALRPATTSRRRNQRPLLGRAARVPPRPRPPYGRRAETDPCCDPITGDHDRADVPPEFSELYGSGAVLCAASDQGHVHGSSCPFMVVLMQPSCSEELDVHRSIACVYCSETGIWGNIISTDAPCMIEYANTGILVGNALYWTSASHRTNLFLVDPDQLTNDILEFDLDTQSLNVIKGPPGMNYSPLHQIVQAEDGAVGLALLSYDKYRRFQMFQRKVDCHGVSTWLLQKTVEMDNILGLRSQIERAMRRIEILGYNEDNGEIFIYADGSVYTVENMSMQSRKIHTTRYINDYHPFTSFYTPGTTIAGGSNEAEMSHNM